MVTTEAGPWDSGAGTRGSRSEKLARGPQLRLSLCCFPVLSLGTVGPWLWFLGAVWCIAFK